MQESLGFSSAKLVFGHTVRCPLKMLKESILSSDSSLKINVLDYVSTFRERLHKACYMARDSLTVAQKNMKCHFDHKSVQRCFKEGDQVLVLLPIVGSALSARFSGPYEVLRKLSNTDYVICTPDRKRKSRVCHVNMLKAFHTRESPRMEVPLAEDAAVPVPVFVATECGDVDAACDADVEDDGVVSRHTYKQCARFKNSEVLSDLPFHLSHLSEKQRSDIVHLLNDFPSLFNDVPSRTTVVQHNIKVGDAIPIKQHAYHVNVAMRAVMRSEVAYLLEHSLAKPMVVPGAHRAY